MTDVDVREPLLSWASSQFVEGVLVTYSPSRDLAAKDAAVTFEAQSHVGSIRVWGHGMIEFIVLDVKTKEDVIRWDKQWTSLEELQAMLHACMDSFAGLTGAA
jgi:hypothetical protein